MPKSKIIPFDYGDNLIRVVKDEETGEPLWVAKDVCDVLDYQNVSKTLDKLDDDEKLIYQIVTSGQKRDVLVINESGLYTLILRSNKPEAKPFKRWVTHEVLPSIRKTGSYGETQNNDALNQIMPVLHTMVEMMKQMMEMQMQTMQMMQQLMEQPKQLQSVPLTPEQLGKIRGAVNLATDAVLSCYEKDSSSRIQKVIYTKLNNTLGVASYIYIPALGFNEAIAIIQEIELTHLLQYEEKKREEAIAEQSIGGGYRYEMPQF